MRAWQSGLQETVLMSTYESTAEWFIANWVRSKFNCTAKIPTNCTTPDKSSSPCKTRFSQTSNIETDQKDLCMFCQIHHCSDYCLKSSTDNSTKNKVI